MDELDRYLAVTHFNVSRVANIYFKEDKVLLKIKAK
jgi:hypothetical protein